MEEQLAEKTQFDLEALMIRVWTGTYLYEVDLEHLRNSAELLDMVFQLNTKVWENERALCEFIQCVEEASQTVFGSTAQMAFCPQGTGRVVNWRAGTTALA